MTVDQAIEQLLSEGYVVRRCDGVRDAARTRQRLRRAARRHGEYVRSGTSDHDPLLVWAFTARYVQNDGRIAEDVGG